MVGKITIDHNKIITIETQDTILKYRFASFGERFLARIIDIVIIFIPSAFIPILPGWLYWSLQQSGNSQSTIGQNALEIKILSLDGKKVTFGQATGRFFGNSLNVLTFFIGYFMFFFNDKNQCLHDMVSECIVVKQIENNYKIGIE